MKVGRFLSFPSYVLIVGEQVGSAHFGPSETQAGRGDHLIHRHSDHLDFHFEFDRDLNKITSEREKIRDPSAENPGA